MAMRPNSPRGNQADTSRTPHGGHLRPRCRLTPCVYVAQHPGSPPQLTSEYLERPPRQLLHDVYELFRQSEQTYNAGDLAHVRHLVKQAVAGAAFVDGTSA